MTFVAISPDVRIVRATDKGIHLVLLCALVQYVFCMPPNVVPFLLMFTRGFPSFLHCLQLFAGLARMRDERFLISRFRKELRDCMNVRPWRLGPFSLQ